MKYFAPLCLVFACFTAPQSADGIWIVKSQVVSVQHPVDCATGAHTKIITQSGTVCVKETPQQVLKTLKDLKDD